MKLDNIIIFFKKSLFLKFISTKCKYVARRRVKEQKIDGRIHDTQAKAIFIIYEAYFSK